MVVKMKNMSISFINLSDWSLQVKHDFMMNIVY